MKDHAARLSRTLEGFGRRSPIVHAAFLGIWVLFLAWLWAISSPPFASPDEPAHVTRAVSLWSGAPLKGEVVNTPEYFTVNTKAPKFFVASQSAPGCWVFQPDAVVGCASYPDVGGEIVDATTTAGLHPPFWYAAIGWIGRLVPSLTGYYLMSAFAALLCAAMIAPLAVTLRTARNSRLELLAALAGITPVALFLCGAVNPSGFEISAAIALWGSGLTSARFLVAGDAVPRPVAVHATIAAVALTLTRPLSPGFAIAILLAIALTVGVTPKALLARRTGVLPAGLIGAALALAGAWAAYSGHLTIGLISTTPPTNTAFEALAGSLASYYLTAIGAFSWLDAGISSIAVLAWVIIMIAIIGLAIAGASTRWMVALGLVALAGHFMPAILQFNGYATNGLVWQGRYGLPWLVGIPLVAAAALSGRDDERGVNRAITIAACAMVVGQFGGYYWAIRRWTVGVNQSWWIFDATTWGPPGPAPLWLLVAAFGVVLAIGALGVATLGRAPLPVTAREPGDGQPDHAVKTDGQPTEPAGERAG